MASSYNVSYGKKTKCMYIYDNKKIIIHFANYDIKLVVLKCCTVMLDAETIGINVETETIIRHTRLRQQTFDQIRTKQ